VIGAQTAVAADMSEAGTCDDRWLILGDSTAPELDKRHLRRIWQ
jgi:hypothetical protein